MRQNIFLKNSSFTTLRSALLKFSAKNVFLLRGRKSYEICGAKEYFQNAIAGLHCSVFEFSDFEDNPKIEDVERGIEHISECSADVIVAIGGGSVLDMGKLIRFLYSFKGDIKKNEFVKQRDILPLIALPTTAGTGAEATQFAVVYRDKIKCSVAHSSVLPDVGIINPVFSYNNPRYLAACTGFDALAQAIEAYWSINATEESDQYAIKAINLLWSDLPAAVNHKIKKSMDSVSEGSYWAGKAINIAKTTAPHALSYAFTTYYNIPHGNAVALTFPFFMGINIHIEKANYKGIISFEQYKMKINFLLKIIGIGKTQLAVSILRKYIESIGLILSVQFDKKLIMSNINLERLRNNPNKILQKDILFVLEEIGKHK
jgi:alcohol dehydrogenase class IV